MKALYLKVVIDIKSKITNGKIKKGEKIPSERELAQQHNVSRNVVREAITVLQNEGYVEVFPGKGSYITEPKLDIVSTTIDRVMGNYNTTLEDIIDVREGLEVYIIKNVIKRANENDIKNLYEIYENMEGNRRDIERFVEYDEKFHLMMAKCTKNPMYEILIHSFIEMTQRVLFDFTRLHPESVAEAQEHHLGLIKLIEKRDKESAVKLIKEHMQVIRDEIRILKERNLIK